MAKGILLWEIRMLQNNRVIKGKRHALFRKHAVSYFVCFESWREVCRSEGGSSRLNLNRNSWIDAILSATITRKASRLRGIRGVSGHMWLKIISFSFSLSRKQRSAFWQAMRGWRKPCHLDPSGLR